MNKAISESEQAAIVRIVKKLEDAWNAGGGEAFGASMAEDADFITI